ncbi:MAG: response regulator transcription factor [Bacteriovoracaceae bacterium]|nr:response regulator transcription factor [Bacteriovoracaceae bacterium]
MGKILIIEDEQDIRDLISFQLKAEGHQVTAAESADKAVGHIERGEMFDLMLVDWMLPGVLSGLEFTRKLRQIKNYKEVPVIMVTALTQPENIVAGLDAGADDYITKPFDLEVLQARVRVQMRALPQNSSSTPQSMGSIFECEELKVDKAKVRVTVADEEIALTSTEFKILTILAEKPGHVFTRTQLISNIQGENIHVTGRTVDTHIAGLRKKLASAGRLIETIRGIGYRFKDGAA